MKACSRYEYQKLKHFFETKTYVGVVVLGEDIQEASIDIRLHVVEFIDISVLEPVH